MAPKTNTPSRRARGALAACALVLAASAVLTSACSKTVAKRTISDERRAEHVASFEYVWETVDRKHWDPEKLESVDWDAAHDELLPEVEAAQTDGEARAVMSKLIARLGQSHFSIIPVDAYDRFDEVKDEDDAPSGSVFGWSGIDARVIDGQGVVTRVHEGSPALGAGVRTGWIIKSINNRDIEELLEIAAGVGGIMRPETIGGQILKGRLGGSEGQTKDFVFIDGDNNERAVELTLAEAPGKVASLGELPPSPVEVEAKTLENGVGYFRLSVFLDPPRVAKEFETFIKAHMDAPGIVIDMRGNPGGIIIMAPGIMNWLVQEKNLEMGAISMRDETRGPFDIPFILYPRKNSYTGKVAVLMDELSISNAEIFPAGLKDIGRATLFGSRTAGLVLPSTVERLPNGDGFQYAFASYTTGSGVPLEGDGAIPDVEVRPTRKGLLEGRDEALEAATDWINDN